MDVSNTIEKLKELVQKGNVSRIVVKRNGDSILNIPVNVGVIGAAVGLAAAVEIVRADGNVVNVMDEESNQKVRDFAAETVEKVKESIPVSINVDVKKDFKDIVDADAEENQPKDSEE